jgi:serine/threonine protein kinase
MYARSILSRESLRDLLLAHIAVEESLVPGHVVAEICLASFLRERGQPSIVPELVAEAGKFTAERVHWLDRETERQLSARGHVDVDPAVSRRRANARRRPLPGIVRPSGPAGEAPTVVRSMAEGRYSDFLLRAQGGRGLVYFAWDGDLTRWVALKVLAPWDEDTALHDPLQFRRPTTGPDASAYQRAYDAFVVEAKRMARMVHPGILSVFEVGETPHGIPYYVMPRGTGFTLRDALAEGPPAGFDGPALLCHVAETVAYAYECHDLVHCDLNPGNIMIGRHGDTHVLDWGEARRPGNWTSPYGAPAVGTPGWVAPELLRTPCRISATIDVYALGAMLFHVLTGSAPFSGQIPLLPARVASEQRTLPPTARIPAADQRLSDLCMRCLDEDPDQRPPSPRAFAEELRAALAGRRSHS